MLSIFRTIIFTPLNMILLAFLAYFFIKFVFLPLYRMQSYRREGHQCYYFPLIGLFSRVLLGDGFHNDAFWYYKHLAKKNPNVPVEISHFSSSVVVVLLDPKLIKKFFSLQNNYIKINPSKAVSALMGTGLVMAEGNLWKNHRKLVASVFHFEFLRENVPLIQDITKEFFAKLKKAPLQKVDIMDEVQKITGEIVGRIFFGENLNQYIIKGKPLTLHLAEITARTSLILRDIPVALALVADIDLERLSRYRRLMEEIKELRSFCFKIVQERKLNKQNNSDALLDKLLETQSNTTPDERFTDEDLINEFVTFFIAGMDTTGHVIAMAIYLLCKDPQYLPDLFEEMNKTYKKDKDVTIEAVNQMDLMHAVLKESMRFFPPVPGAFPREALVDHDIMGVRIKKGMSVGVISLYNHFNEKYFESPEKFMPERWMKKDQDLDPYVFTPFSAGSRNCIGQNLAIIEAKIILAEFFDTFNFKMTSKDYKLRMTQGFLYEPRDKLYMDLTLKN